MDFDPEMPVTTFSLLKKTKTLQTHNDQFTAIFNNLLALLCPNTTASSSGMALRGTLTGNAVEDGWLTTRSCKFFFCTFSSRLWKELDTSRRAKSDSWCSKTVNDVKFTSTNFKTEPCFVWKSGERLLTYTLEDINNNNITRDIQTAQLSSYYLQFSVKVLFVISEDSWNSL